MRGGARSALALLAAVCTAAAPSAPPSEPDRIVFGGSKSYPPFEWVDEDGRPKGFLIDLEETIAESAGIEARHRHMEWDRLLEALASGEVDAVPMFSSRGRAERFRFTEPFYYLTHGIFTRQGGEVAAAPLDLAGRSVAVVRHGYAAEELRQMNIEATLVERHDIRAALHALSGGQSDFALLARHTARRIIQGERIDVHQVSPPLWPRPYVFAVRKEDEALFALLAHHLALIESSGRYNEIYEKWEAELERTTPTFADFARRYAWVIGVPLLAIMLIGGWSWSLQRRVLRRTQALYSELRRREAAERKATYRAGHDILTGLPNGAKFLDDTNALIATRHGVPITMVSIGLRRLEEIVSTFGYRATQALFRSFAERLKALDFDALGYLGAGIYICTHTGHVSPASVRAEITEPIELEGMEIDPQLAIGMVTDSTGEHEAGELLRRAQITMTAAWKNRRPWQIYGPELEPDENALFLLQEYRRCGTRDFTVHFQPQIDLRTQKVAGAEALVRWRHPEHGMISPGVFIPLLEKSGLIFRVTEHVLDTAVAFAAECRRRGEPLRISANVSASDLLEHDLVALIKEAMARHSGRYRDLCVEMTETGFISEPERVRSVLYDLAELGVVCVIDDFGTGYSSLSYLSHFPVAGIKLDKLFVGTMREDDYHRAIVESTIGLAHRLDLRVVAEGAEDATTVALLRDSGCDLVQGFVYAPGLPADDLVRFMRDRPSAETAG